MGIGASDRLITPEISLQRALHLDDGFKCPHFAVVVLHASAVPLVIEHQSGLRRQKVSQSQECRAPVRAGAEAEPQGRDGTRAAARLRHLNLKDVNGP